MTVTFLVSLQVVASRCSYLLGALLFGLTYSLGFASACLAQAPPSPPQSQSPEDSLPTLPNATQPVPVPSPSPTFRRGDLPPETNSTPVYEERESRPFRTYRLAIGDGINVNVIDFPEFNFAGTIDSEGNVFVPILGKVPVVGLTLQEVETKIAYELSRRFLKEEPEIAATLVAARPVQLTLLGEVVRPGFYTLPPQTSLVSILLSAGGATSKADLRSIVIRRSLVDGTVLEEKVDLYTPLIKGEKAPDVQLQGGDTVIVSRLEFGQEQGYDRNLLARTNLVQPSITVRLLAPNLDGAGISLRNLNVPSGSTFLDVVASLPAADTLRVNFDEVTLLRFDPEKGRVVTQTLSPTSAVEGDTAQNIPLQEQDVIVVSRTLLGKILSAFRTITQPIRDVFGFSDFIFDLPNRFD
ncbi:polysaccharide export protein [Hydrococcus rivularis NIES-593]|uniref:Polysaccharide export protein n=2 Tax=Hydrococcus TaxID=1616833 RepID=A0A1U7HJX1_9CYAN|nr:polysaccharide export protein [Hydrococcus rivularis NIES-593]